MNKVILICGYRRTGKDMLCSILMNICEENDRFKWRIYKHPGNGVEPGSTLGGIFDSTQLHQYFDSSLYMRTSFADALKRQASEVYGIPLIISDSEKDIKQFTHYKTGEIVSARDIYIEWGAIRRSQDIDWWCKAALTSIPSRGIDCIIPDWRFKNEAKYMINNFEHVTTVRVYRSDVPEPPADISSEHDLDEYLTDFLLLPDGVEGEFEKVINKFPQYSEYVPFESI